MGMVRIGLANLPYPASIDDATTRAVGAIDGAAEAGVAVLCLPECYVPGYRVPGRDVAPTDGGALERAWQRVAQAAGRTGVAVVLGTERLVDARPVITALVIGPDGTALGFQDKVQLDPSEEATYVAGRERRVFTIGALTFGVVICHEGWRYPETVRWAARRGAQVVFHPAFHEAGPGSYQPTTFADPANSFHEKAALCRAAENTCYFATVNYASDGSPTTSAVVDPEGVVVAWQPYGQPGVLLADLDLSRATGLLAARCRTTPL